MAVVKKVIVGVTILLITLIFSPGLANFFHADDWLFLDISRIKHVSEFVNFFSFHSNPEVAGFYRPLSTQVFFFVFQSLFGLNVIPYHIFIFALFALSLLLLFKLVFSQTNDFKKSVTAMIIYGISVTNFSRLYFLSAGQEIFMTVFTLMSILLYQKPEKLNFKILSLAFFILALLSKETAVVLPLIIFVIDYLHKKFSLKKIFPYFLILIPYLYFRLAFFGNAVGDSYVWSLSPLKAANTFIWYFLWSLGTPEVLLAHTGNNFLVRETFFQAYPTWSKILLLFIGGTVISFILLIISQIRHLSKSSLVGAAIFFIALFPVLFLPLHKFSLELGLPMVGFALLVVSLLKFNSRLTLLFLSIFVILNLLSNIFTFQTHYEVKRGKIAHNVVQYFSANFAVPPKNSYFEFTNDWNVYDGEWGIAKRISNAVEGSNLFRVLFKDHNYNVYYENLPGKRPEGQKKISLRSGLFLQNL